MTETALPPERYQIEGSDGARQVLDRFAVRDRIRAGTITTATSLARAGSQRWFPAAQFPELQRYFSLRATSSSTQRPSASGAAPPGTSYFAHLGAAVSIPFSGVGVATTVVLALLLSVARMLLTMPLHRTRFRFVILVFVAFVGGLVVSTLLQVVRAAANGATEMPVPQIEEVGEHASLFLKALGLSILAAWPVWLSWGIFIYAGYPGSVDRLDSPSVVPGILLSLLFVVLYHPVVVATVAVWDNFAEPLNPFFTVRVIRLIGIEYLQFMLLSLVATGIVVGTLHALSRLTLPVLPNLLAHATLLWVGLGLAHLLGVMVQRHVDDLGWE